MYAPGIDFGSLYSEIAVAQKGGVDVIANETSRRKTPSLVAFDAQQRFFGESADSGWKRNTKNTIFNFKRLLGKKFKEEDVQKEIERGLAYKVVEVEESGEVGVEVDYEGERRVFSVRQITAMYLAHLKEIMERERATKGNFKVSDVVLSVPSWYTESQRRALLDSAKIAGFNPLELIEDTTAVGLAYGIYKLDLDEKKPINVIFYDLGHCSLQVALISFTKSSMKVLATAFDTNLGARDFDAALVQKLLEMIKEKYKMDAKSDPRALLRLTLAARSLRETLSANPRASFFVECLMQDKDVNFEFKREDFEQICEPLFHRLSLPLQQVLSNAKLTSKDIHSLELVGDTRATPKLQSLLSEFIGLAVSKTMNSTEAVAKGCAWQCARLSPLFHVRDFKMESSNSFPIQASFSWRNANPTGTSSENSLPYSLQHEMDSLLFPAQATFPSKKMCTFPKSQIPEKLGMEISLSYVSEQVPFHTPHIATFVIPNVPTNNENISKSSLKVSVQLGASGILSIAKAYKEFVENITYEVEEEVPLQDTPPSPSSPSSAQQTTDEQKMDTSQENSEQPTKEQSGEKKEEEKKEEKKEEKPKTKKVKVQKKKDVTKTIELQVESQTYSLSPSKLNELIEAENAMRSQDALIIATQVAKNAVESYVYELRSSLHEKLEPYVEEQVKEEFSKLLSDTENWLYEDGENCAKSVYNQKLEQLRKIGDPMKNRYSEDQDRAFFVEKLNGFITSCLEFSNSADPKYEHITAEEKEKVANEAKEAQKWLNDNLQTINNQPKTVDPPITCKQIESRSEQLSRVTLPIINKPKPAPKPEEKKEEKKEEAKSENGANPPQEGDSQKKEENAPETNKQENEGKMDTGN